ncbi:nucleotidyltransferase family protein [Paenibacillus tarimensis]
MGMPKLSLELSDGKTLGSVALEQLSRLGIDPLVVVVRADDPLDWLPNQAENSQKWRTETCFTAHLGLAFSLRCGMSAVLPSKPDALLVALADQPFVRTEPIEQMISAMREHPELDYAASGNSGKAMPPALFARSMFPVLESLNGDKGAREIFRCPDYRGVVFEPEDSDYFIDADTLEDFEQVKNKYERKSLSMK